VVFLLLLYKLHRRGQSVRHLDLKELPYCLLVVVFSVLCKTNTPMIVHFHRAVHSRPFQIELALFSPPAHIHIMTGNRKFSYTFSPLCLRRVDSWKLLVPSLMLFERKAFPMLSMATSSLPCSRTARKPT